MITDATVERRASVINPTHPGDPGIAEIFGLTGQNASGEAVTPTTAMSIDAFMGGVNYLSRTIASLPLHIYRRREPRGREEATDHRLYYRLHDQPNNFQTSFEWRVMLICHAILTGNAYSRILPDGRLLPHHPDRVTPFWAPNGERAYEYQPPPGAPNGIYNRIILQSEMLHITFMPGDGLRGKSVLEYQRDTIGQMIASTKYRASLRRLGDRLGGVLQVKKKLSPEALKRLREQWTQRYTGAENAGKTAILEEDMDWKPVAMTAQDAQTAQLLELDRESAAIILGIPPHKVGAMRRSTFSNIEHQSIEAVQDSIRPWCVSIEQCYKRDLFGEAERRTYYAEHNLDGLLRGDFKTRQEGLAIMRSWGIIDGNDWAENENRNEFEGGDVRLVPLNMVPLERAAQPAGSEGDAIRAQPALRETRSSEVMQRLRSAYLPIIEDAGRRLLRREADAIERQFRRQAQERSLAEFLAWIESYYAEHRVPISQTMTPAIASYIAAMAAEAASMIGAPAAPTDDLASGYVAALTARWVSDSRGAVIAAVGQDNPDRIAQSIQAVLQDWRRDRAGRQARREAVQAAAAAARYVWSAAGVLQIRWVKNADCDECDELSGRVVSIREEFTEGLQHPPLHDGCQCSIVPVTKGGEQ